MPSKFWAQLDAANDEQDVRRRIAEGLYHQPHLGVAQEWIRRRDEAKASQRHAELIYEIKRPHWSVTPSFYLLVASVLLTAVALGVAFVGLPQSQQHVSVTPPSAKAPPPAAGKLPNLPPIPPNSTPAQAGTTKK